MLTHLQTSSRGCLWPRGLGERELHRGERHKNCVREMNREVNGLTCRLPDYSLAEC